MDFLRFLEDFYGFFEFLVISIFFSAFSNSVQLSLGSTQNADFECLSRLSWETSTPHNNL